MKLENLTTDRRKNRQCINWVKLAETDRIPYGENIAYQNPRVTFDGLNWWISVGVKIEPSTSTPQNNGIGIDLGVKNLAICSDGNTYKNINKSQKIKKLEKNKHRLQRSISRKYNKNKKGGRYCKTSNIVKSEKKLLKIYHKLTDIRNDYLHKTTSEIVQREPSFICLEDLNVKDLMKNKHLSKALQDQKLSEFKRQIKYKSKIANIQVVTADKFYPSSKTCSRCGNIKKDLKLKNRVYKCDKCGLVIDRDFQAALNLKNYGEKFLEEAF